MRLGSRSGTCTNNSSGRTLLCSTPKNTKNDYTKWRCTDEHFFCFHTLKLDLKLFISSFRISWKTQIYYNIMVKESPELNINLVDSPPISHSSFCQFGLALLSNNMIGIAELQSKTGNHASVLNENLFCWIALGILRSDFWALFLLLRWGIAYTDIVSKVANKF